MVRMLSYVVSGICLIMLGLGPTGCANSSEHRPPESAEATGIISRFYADSKQADLDNNITKDRLTHIDYSQIVNKIWIVREWEGGAYSHLFSFFISTVEDEKIQGKLVTGAIAERDFYSAHFLDSPYLPNYLEARDLSTATLVGIIRNGVYECEFDDKLGNTGSIAIEPIGVDEIEATVRYTGRNKASAGIPSDGIYHLRPYNLSDMNGFVKDNSLSFPVDLNVWHDVVFVVGEFRGTTISGSEIAFPEAFLSDEQENILYRFSAPFQTGTKIISVAIDEINDDESKDVRIVTVFFDYDTGLTLDDMPQIEWNFFQMENGMFYDSSLDTEGGQKDIVGP